MGLLKAASDAHARAKEQGAQAKAASDARQQGQLERDESPATRWEYKTIRVGEDKQKGLLGSGRMDTLFNRLGVLGWELVAVNLERATFKREVPHMSAAEAAEIAALPAEGDGG